MIDQDKINFKEKYQDNPVAFCEDFYNVKLHSYQKVILNNLEKGERYKWIFPLDQFEEACQFAEIKRQEIFGEFAGNT